MIFNLYSSAIKADKDVLSTFTATCDMVNGIWGHDHDQDLDKVSKEDYF